MPRPTQHEVFHTIQDKAKRKQENGTVLTQAVITKYLKDLYNPHLRGRLYFYDQDKNGLPIAKVPTYIAGGKHYCSVALENAFSAEDWQGQLKPAGFIGKVWPPKAIEDLIGDVDKTEDCVRECYICNEVEDGFCRCGYNSWKDYWPGYWPTHLLLQRAGARGYGVFAREAIQDSTIIGEYTGCIMPVKTNGASGEDAYRTRISIGGCNTKQQSQTTATLDALHTGSILRFINHSCNPNARLHEFRCGMERRVVYVVAIRDVTTNEELTIDYGPKWLDGECLCGSADCRNPPTGPEVLDLPMRDLSEDETADVYEYESLVLDVSDSSEDDVKTVTDNSADVDSDTDVWDMGYRSSDPEYEDQSEYEEHSEDEEHKQKRRTC
jgi:hypothetical protein